MKRTAKRGKIAASRLFFVHPVYYKASSLRLFQALNEILAHPDTLAFPIARFCLLFSIFRPNICCRPSHARVTSDGRNMSRCFSKIRVSFHFTPLRASVSTTMTTTAIKTEREMATFERSGRTIHSVSSVSFGLRLSSAVTIDRNSR